MGRIIAITKRADEWNKALVSWSRGRGSGGYLNISLWCLKPTLTRTSPSASTNHQHPFDVNWQLAGLPIPQLAASVGTNSLAWEGERWQKAHYSPAEFPSGCIPLSHCPQRPFQIWKDACHSLWAFPRLVVVVKLLSDGDLGGDWGRSLCWEPSLGLMAPMVSSHSGVHDFLYFRVRLGCRWQVLHPFWLDQAKAVEQAAWQEMDGLAFFLFGHTSTVWLTDSPGRETLPMSMLWSEKKVVLCRAKGWDLGFVHHFLGRRKTLLVLCHPYMDPMRQWEAVACSWLVSLEQVSWSQPQIKHPADDGDSHGTWMLCSATASRRSHPASWNTLTSCCNTSTLVISE